eukprot:scaffold19425_cov129-Isochrysis_galbana.AAC.6
MLSERPAPFCGEAGIMTPGGPLKLERFAGEGYRNGEPSRAMLPPRAAELPGEDARWTVAEPVKERASMARATCCPGLFWVSPAVWPGGAGLASCELTVGFGRSSFSDLGAFEPIFVASVATIAARCHVGPVYHLKPNEHADHKLKFVDPVALLVQGANQVFVQLFLQQRHTLKLLVPVLSERTSLSDKGAERSDRHRNMDARPRPGALRIHPNVAIANRRRRDPAMVQCIAIANGRVHHYIYGSRDHVAQNDDDDPEGKAAEVVSDSPWGLLEIVLAIAIQVHSYRY